MPRTSPCGSACPSWWPWLYAPTWKPRGCSRQRAATDEPRPGGRRGLDDPAMSSTTVTTTGPTTVARPGHPWRLSRLGDARGIPRPEAPGRTEMALRGARRPARQLMCPSPRAVVVRLDQPDRVAPHSATASWPTGGQRRRPGALSGDAPHVRSTDRQHRPAGPGRRRSWRSENRPTRCRPMRSCRCRRRSGHRMSRCRPR